MKERLVFLCLSLVLMTVWFFAFKTRLATEATILLLAAAVLGYRLRKPGPLFSFEPGTGFLLLTLALCFAWVTLLYHWCW
jgi:hypothetical protein